MVRMLRSIRSVSKSMGEVYKHMGSVSKAYIHENNITPRQIFIYRWGICISAPEISEGPLYATFRNLLISMIVNMTGNDRPYQ